MKNRTIIIAALSLMAFTSCYELDRYPQGQLSDGTFWLDDEDARQGIIPCYAGIKQYHIFGTIFGTDCISDVGTGYDEYGFADAATGSWISTTGLAASRWKQSYEAIRRCNMAISYIQNSTGITEKVKAETLGEAHFLRALLYFQLTNYFGALPLYDETVDYNRDYATLKSPRSDAEAVNQLIVKDLDAAVVQLPVKWGATDYGRATRGAAYALRGKVHLYHKDYKLAIKDFEEIVLDPTGKGYGYELNPNYTELFNQKGHTSSEIIFSIQNYLAVGFNYGMPMGKFMGNPSTFSGWNQSMPSVALADMYECSDGKKFDWDNFIPNYKANINVRRQTFMSTLTSDNKKVATYPMYRNELLAMYDKRDPRMKQTFILPYTFIKGFVSNAEMNCEFVYAKGIAAVNGFVVVNRYGNETTLLYLYRKFVPEGNMNGQLIGGNDRENIPINFPLIRLADVYLLLAEAYNEDGAGAANVENSVKYINKVRARTSTHMPLLNNGDAWMEAKSQVEVRQRIMHERAVELAGEGHRYLDIKRWKTIETIQNATETDILGNMVYQNKFEKKDYLWPIPPAAIDQNSNLAPNNPGWE